MTGVTTNPPLSLTRMAAALRYLDALDEIEGWLLPTTALAMIEVLWEQERLGAVGDIAEMQPLLLLRHRTPFELGRFRI